MSSRWTPTSSTCASPTVRLCCATRSSASASCPPGEKWRQPIRWTGRWRHWSESSTPSRPSAARSLSPFPWRASRHANRIDYEGGRPMARLREIVFECEHAAALARFWAAALDGYAVRPYDDAEIARLAAKGLTPETDPTVLVDGPGPSLCFQEGRPVEVRRSRIHLDIEVPDRTVAVARLRGLGASIRCETDGYTVMEDPEGNVLCVVQARE